MNGAKKTTGIQRVLLAKRNDYAGILATNPSFITVLFCTKQDWVRQFGMGKGTGGRGNFSLSSFLQINKINLYLKRRKNKT